MFIRRRALASEVRSVMRQTEENIEKDWNHSKQGKKKSHICPGNTVLHFLRVGTNWGEHLYAQNGWNEEIHNGDESRNDSSYWCRIFTLILVLRSLKNSGHLQLDKIMIYLQVSLPPRASKVRTELSWIFTQVHRNICLYRIHVSKYISFPLFSLENPPPILYFVNLEAIWYMFTLFQKSI